MAEINETKSKFNPRKRKWSAPGGGKDLELYPNQDAFCVNKLCENYMDDGVTFGIHSKEATFLAVRSLGKSALQLYLWFIMNDDKYQSYLSPVLIMDDTGMSRASFYNARNELEEKGYLHLHKKSNSLDYDRWDFYETPYCNPFVMQNE